jgi:hypothetical protein
VGGKGKQRQNTGSTGKSSGTLPPSGTFISRTIIVMMIAITPSLNASIRPLPISPPPTEPVESNAI